MTDDKVSAPYVSYERFKGFLAKLHGATIPHVLDASVYSGYDGSTKSQLRIALRFFGLVDAQNRPSPDLAAVAEASLDKDRWAGAIKKLIAEPRYQGIWAHPLTTTTPQQLESEFQTEYGMAANVARKAATFFISAAKDADIELSPRIANRPRGGAGTPRRPRRKENGGDHGKVIAPAKKVPPAATMSITAQDLIGLPLAQMDAELQKAVWSLVLYLKGEEAKATKAIEDDHDDDQT